MELYQKCHQKKGIQTGGQAVYTYEERKAFMDKVNKIKQGRKEYREKYGDADALEIKRVAKRKAIACYGKGN